MKNILGTAVLMIIVFSRISFSQSSASMTANSTATIVKGLSCSHGENSDLAFGKIISSNQSGTVQVWPHNSSRTNTGGAILTSGITPTAAQFHLEGEPNIAFSITLPSSAVTIISGSNTMTVEKFTCDTGPGQGLNGAGWYNTNVGGTLNVAANQPAGSYTGTFTVTFAY